MNSYRTEKPSDIPVLRTAIRAQRRYLFGLVGCATLALAGCGSGADTVGTGGVSFGGQDPDPVVVDFPIAYVKRSIPVDANGNPVGEDVRQLTRFNIGADLFVRDRASPSAIERNVTAEVTADVNGMLAGSQSDIRDLSVSYDGSKLLFAMRGPRLENVDEDEQPTWNLWIYDFTLDSLRRVIGSDISADDSHDISPVWLPDGRIIFASTRQRQAKAILLDEGKPQFAALDEDRDEAAFALHVMNDDGSDIRQVTFNQSHDFAPAVLGNGQVVFSRWDNNGPLSEINLYRMNPDGRALELLYGANSHATGTNGSTVEFLNPQPMPDGNLLAVVKSFQPNDFGGDLVVIDTSNFVDNEQAIAAVAPMPGPAQQKATVNDVRTNDPVSPGGVYNSAFPLFDGTGRLLVSWSECRLVDDMERIVPCTDANLAMPEFQPAPPLYGVWIYDGAIGTQLPVVAPEEGVVYNEVVAAQPRAFAPVVFDELETSDPVLVEENVGILDIRSVYDVTGQPDADIASLADPAVTTAAERPARFLRIEKAVSLPDDDLVDLPGTAFGRSAQQGMKEIIGYAPIEPDGSVRVKVPADVALMLSVLDERGRRTSARHQSWLQVRAGQTLACNGCHVPDAGLSHGRSEAFASVYAGAPTTSLPFPNTTAAIFADFGETMAQARTRISCAGDCAAMTPTVDIVFEDVWTDPVAAMRPADLPFSYSYLDLATPLPVAPDCLTDWSARCRIVIDYETHIHPLWGLPRITFDVDGTTVLADDTCSSCHNVVDAMGATQVPAAQLDLSDGPSSDQPDHLTSYRELLFTDNEQVLDMGALIDRLVEVGIDPVTSEPVFATVPVGPVLRVQGARASFRFFDLFDAGGTHAGRLSPAELKLLAEWLDIGGQYYNNPFNVPQN